MIEYFLPSEIARLVLGYLTEENLIQTIDSFKMECPHLAELIYFSNRGRVISTSISGKSLKIILEEYGLLMSTASNFNSKDLVHKISNLINDNCYNNANIININKPISTSSLLTNSLHSSSEANILNFDLANPSQIYNHISSSTLNDNSSIVSNNSNNAKHMTIRGVHLFKDSQSMFNNKVTSSSINRSKEDLFLNQESAFINQLSQLESKNYSGKRKFNSRKNSMSNCKKLRLSKNDYENASDSSFCSSLDTKAKTSNIDLISSNNLKNSILKKDHIIRININEQLNDKSDYIPSYLNKIDVSEKCHDNSNYCKLVSDNISTCQLTDISGLRDYTSNDKIAAKNNDSSSIKSNSIEHVHKVPCSNNNIKNNLTKSNKTEIKELIKFTEVNASSDSGIQITKSPIKPMNNNARHCKRKREKPIKKFVFTTALIKQNKKKQALVEFAEKLSTDDKFVTKVVDNINTLNNIEDSNNQELLNISTMCDISKTEKEINFQSPIKQHSDVLQDKEKITEINQTKQMNDITDETIFQIVNQLCDDPFMNNILKELELDSEKDCDPSVQSSNLISQDKNNSSYSYYSNMLPENLTSSLSLNPISFLANIDDLFINNHSHLDKNDSQIDKDLEHNKIDHLLKPVKEISNCDTDSNVQNNKASLDLEVDKLNHCISDARQRESNIVSCQLVKGDGDEMNCIEVRFADDNGQSGRVERMKLVGYDYGDTNLKQLNHESFNEHLSILSNSLSCKKPISSTPLYNYHEHQEIPINKLNSANVVNLSFAQSTNSVSHFTNIVKKMNTIELLPTIVNQSSTKSSKPGTLSSSKKRYQVSSIPNKSNLPLVVSKVSKSIDFNNIKPTDKSLLSLANVPNCTQNFSEIKNTNLLNHVDISSKLDVSLNKKNKKIRKSKKFVQTSNNQVSYKNKKENISKNSSVKKRVNLKPKSLKAKYLTSQDINIKTEKDEQLTQGNYVNKPTDSTSTKLNTKLLTKNNRKNNKYIKNKLKIIEENVDTQKLFTVLKSCSFNEGPSEDLKQNDQSNSMKPNANCSNLDKNIFHIKQNNLKIHDQTTKIKPKKKPKNVDKNNIQNSASNILNIFNEPNQIKVENTTLSLNDHATLAHNNNTSENISLLDSISQNKILKKNEINSSVNVKLNDFHLSSNKNCNSDKNQLSSQDELIHVFQSAPLSDYELTHLKDIPEVLDSNSISNETIPIFQIPSKKINISNFLSKLYNS